MDDHSIINKNVDDSISGQSVALFIAEDDSLAGLVLSHGIKVRDFVLLSFLSDQGRMSKARLSRAAGIELRKTQKSLNRLAAAGFLVYDPSSANTENEVNVILTDSGQEMADRITGHLPR